MIGLEVVEELVRSFTYALEHEDPLEARKKLLSAGWLDALDADPAVATAIVFGVQGQTLHDVAALDDVLAWGVLKDGMGARGDVAVAYPINTSLSSGTVSHIVLPAHRDAEQLLWLSELEGDEIELVDLQDALDGPVISGIDPNFGLIGFASRPSGRVTALDGDEVEKLWGSALTAGRTALCHQIVGGSLSMLKMAVQYAGRRRQFDTPIGAFQAVKHRLAEALVAISVADAAAAAASSGGHPATAAVAKVLAGRAAAMTARHCLQVFGGSGFTTDHDFHRYFRRNLVLDRLLGDARALEREMGRGFRMGPLREETFIDLDDGLGTHVGTWTLGILP